MANTQDRRPPGCGKGGAADPSGESSLDLLRRAREGDREALEALVQRLVPPLRRWATHRLPRYARDLRDTDDLIQEAVIAAIQKLDSIEYRGRGSIHAYVRQIVANRIREEIDRVVRRPRTAPIDHDPQDPAPSPLEEAIGREALERYELALSKLGEDDREAIVSRIEMGLSYEELACVLARASPDAARMAVSRALVRLAREMRLA